MHFCVFCGKDLRRGGDFVQNKDGNLLCKTCVETAEDIFKRKQVADHDPSRKEKGAGKLDLKRIIKDFSPQKIFDSLSEYVIGQEEAKKVLSLAVYNHYKILSLVDSIDVEFEKSNILLFI